MFFSWPSAATIASTNSRKSQAAFLRSCKHTANLLPCDSRGSLSRQCCCWFGRWRHGDRGVARDTASSFARPCPRVPPTVENGGRFVKQTPND